MTRLAAILPLCLLAACAAPEPPLPYISEQALAALPKGTDLRTVRRRDDGCYLIVVDDEMSGFVHKVVDAQGRLVCDEV